MIITCPCNKKKFTIDDSLIPVEGRNLKCGTCDRVWFYKIEHKTPEPINSEVQIEEKVIKPTVDTLSNSNNSESLKKKLEQELNKDIKKDDIIQNSDLPKKSKNIPFSKIFSYIIVFIISFAVFVILIDTLKTPLITIFPGLEILLFNLFETLKDIKLFIIDLS